ncbi:MAG: NrfD/PsrC family molybdoenzyme membrane anchor subunit [Halanaeroarchaeum sp.]
MAGIEFIWLEPGHWGLTTAIYLFFAALGGGAYLAGLTAVGLESQRDQQIHREFARWAFLAGLGAVGVAGVAILSHLADPLAGLLFPLTLTNFGSWITRGTWILVSLGVITALQVLWFHFGALATEATGASAFLRALFVRAGVASPLDRLADATRPTDGRYWVVGILGALPAIGTVYTGFELATVPTVPLWNQPTLLPALFLASGVATGFAVALALTVAFEGVSNPLVATVGTIVGLALLVSAGLLWRLWEAVGTNPAGEASVAALTTGPLQVPFAIGVVGIGASLIATPLLAWVAVGRGETSTVRWLVRPGLVTALSLAVVGSFFLRYALVLAAVKDPVVVVGL